MKKALLFLVFSVFQQVYAQQEKPSTKEGHPYIEVNAVAERDVMPDNIYIKITIKEIIDGREKTDIIQQESDLKEGLKKLDLENSKLQLLDAQTDFIKIKRQKNQSIASKDFLLIVRTAAEASKVFQLLDRLNIFEADIYKTTHSRIDSIAKEVRIEAMKAARAKAEYMLAAINEKPGSAIVVYEVKRDLSNSFRISNSISQVYSNNLIEQNNKEDEIGFEVLKLKIEVFVKFEIRQ